MKGHKESSEQQEAPAVWGRSSYCTANSINMSSALHNGLKAQRNRAAYFEEVCAITWFWRVQPLIGCAPVPCGIHLLTVMAIPASSLLSGAVSDCWWCPALVSRREG